MAVADPTTILTQFFPGELLNFDVPPPGYDIGPLNAIFKAAGQALAGFTHDDLLLQAQVAISGASGEYLDWHGIAYSTVRLANEEDAPYRTRILAALTSGRLTIPAIAMAVTAYYASTLALDSRPTVTVWDLQSRPDLAAQFNIVRCQFVVDIAFELSPANVFFANRSYANRNTFALESDGYSELGPDAGDANLEAVVNAYKDAAVQPIYRIYTVFGTTTRAAIQFGAGAVVHAGHVKTFGAGAKVIQSPSLGFGAGTIVKGTNKAGFSAGAKIFAPMPITTDDTLYRLVTDDTGYIITTDS